MTPVTAGISGFFVGLVTASTFWLGILWEFTRRLHEHQRNIQSAERHAFHPGSDELDW
jgi:hypothetical protein